MNSLICLLLLGTAAASICTSKDCTADGDLTSLIQVQQHVVKRSHEAGAVNDVAVEAVPKSPRGLEAAPTQFLGGASKQLRALEGIEAGQKQYISDSLKLAHKFAKASETMEEGSYKSLFKMFAICGKCDKFERWGEDNDGGYLTCMDNVKEGAVRGAYSLGIADHDKWSEDAAQKLGLKVNQFDCTVDQRTCTECNFYKKCIVAADGSINLAGQNINACKQNPVACRPGPKEDGWSLAQALAETGQADAPDGSLIMKMDIERSEWPIYASESPETLKKFGQLIVEFHALHDITRHPMYLKAMANILASGLKVAHLHGNNDVGMIQLGDTTFPRVVEVTFIQSDARPEGCLRDQDYDALLDNTNWPNTEELPMIHIGHDYEHFPATDLQPFGAIQMHSATTQDTLVNAETEWPAEMKSVTGPAR